MSTITIIVTLCYGILILILIYGFSQVKDFEWKAIKPKTQFSVIVPFKNEADNLTELLTSLFELNYPSTLFEVILVDDDSSDASVDIINRFMLNNNSDIKKIDLKIIKNRRWTQSSKKDAITTAIAQAKFEWIVTTDADCIAPSNWLVTFDAFIQNHSNAGFIAAPVAYHHSNSFVERFQALDFLSLMGTTIGSFGIKKPLLCNGANLAYRKSVFYTVDGFKGNAHLASGDDIFLLEKVVKYNPSSVYYLKSKDAVVFTKPMPNLKSLINQRLRWASKTSNYKSGLTKIIGLIVLAMNAFVVIGFFLMLVNAFSVKVLMICFSIKLILDVILILKTAQFFNQTALLNTYFSGSLLYPFFCSYIAVFSAFKSYRWKGQVYKK